jgi:hypothetical protein
MGKANKDPLEKESRVIEMQTLTLGSVSICDQERTAKRTKTGCRPPSSLAGFEAPIRGWF